MKFSRLRTAILTCVLGIVSVSFFKFEYAKWNEPYVELPQVASESPIVVKVCPELKSENTRAAYTGGAKFWCDSYKGGGSGCGKKDNAQSSTLVRKFFISLPEKYFYVESDSRDKNKYLDRFLEIEDDENGYLEGSGDGAQKSL